MSNTSNTGTQKTDPTSLLQAIDGAVTRVRTKALDFSFNELFDMYKSSELIIDPEFQRLFRWKEGASGFSVGLDWQLDGRRVA